MPGFCTRKNWKKILRQEFLFQLAVEPAAIYQELQKEEIIPKSPTNINLHSHIRKTCQVTYCEGYKTIRKSTRNAKNMCVAIVHLRTT